MCNSEMPRHILTLSKMVNDSKCFRPRTMNQSTFDAVMRNWEKVGDSKEDC